MPALLLHPSGFPCPNRRAIDELACPQGFYCPTPAQKLRCPAGYFCGPSTIQPVTCNMTMLVDRAPLLKIPDKPLTVVQVNVIHGCAVGLLWLASTASWLPNRFSNNLPSILARHRPPAASPAPPCSACSSWETRCRATRAPSTPAALRCCAQRGAPGLRGGHSLDRVASCIGTWCMCSIPTTRSPPSAPLQLLLP